MSGDNVIRIDAAASKTHTDSLGNTWLSDRYYSGGSATLGAFDVLGTDTDDAMYDECRFGAKFGYTSLANGTYNLCSSPRMFHNAGRRVDQPCRGQDDPEQL